jgi:iron complex transport system ATP-binding protein
MLAARDLGLQLGGATVLDGVSLAIPRGAVTAIIGPNGAGKSSLLGCLAGLRVPARGQVTLDEAALATVPARLRAQRIGYLPQVAEVNWDVDVATLVALGRLPHAGRWRQNAGDAAAIAAALAAIDMGRMAHRIVGTLSGGERARALLARVLAGQPEYLLADEPLANLDPGHQLDSLACLRAAATAGAGVVIVLHDLGHALRVADQIVLLDAGRVVAAGVPDDVLTPERIAAVYGVATARVALPGGLVITGRA